MRSRMMVGLAGLLVSASLAWADRLVLVAGGDATEDGVPATKAKLIGPFGVDFDQQGNMYVVELAGGRVLRVDGKGVLTRVAGTGKKGNGGDGGPGLKAEFNGMHSLAIAPDGTVYLADTWNNRVRKYDPKTGTVTGFAGTGDKGYGGPAAQAKFGGIYCAALDPKGERLYLADLDNRRIRAVDRKTGVVSTVAGNGQKGRARGRGRGGEGAARRSAGGGGGRQGQRLGAGTRRPCAARGGPQWQDPHGGRHRQGGRGPR